jgi:hypothetical protein
MLLLLLPMLLLSMLLLPVSFEKSLFLILQKFFRPCCCGCGGCGCCGCGGGRKRRAIQELSHKLMNKNVAQFTQQNDSSEIEESEAAAATTAILEAETTTPEATKIVETTTLAAIRKMTNAKIDSFGRRQF